MTVQSVIREVCSFVGVRPPQGTVFVSPLSDRTAWEFLNLANEMAQRIAYDTRDWQALRKLCVFSGNGSDSFPLPSDFHRMLLSANVWRSTNANTPMRFVSDPDEWIRREKQGYFDAGGEWLIDGNAMSNGEWMISGDEMHIRPQLASLVPATPGDPLAIPPIPATAEIPPETAEFYYLRNTPVRLSSGGFGSQFLNDADTFVLPERLLKLGLIWQWKANKGASYAEDLANYEDALGRVAGNDKPSPVIIG